MPRASDQAYLREQQYRDSSKLNARIALHARFSTNTYGWFPWLFDHLLRLPAKSRILEVGCGTGLLWRRNAARIPPGWDVTLTDFSPGMLDETRQALSSIEHPFSFQVADAQELPFADASFDAIIANHILYHVPDRPKAFAAFRRVLPPDGRLFASTIGQAHLRELNALAPELRFQPSFGHDLDFDLERGQGELAAWFPRVEMDRYDDALVVTEAAPLVAYVLSSRMASGLTAEARANLMRHVERDIARHGAIRITKDSGLFEAWNTENMEGRE